MSVIFLKEKELGTKLPNMLYVTDQWCKSFPFFLLHGPQNEFSTKIYNKKREKKKLRDATKTRFLDILVLKKKKNSLGTKVLFTRSKNESWIIKVDWSQHLHGSEVSRYYLKFNSLTFFSLFGYRGIFLVKELIRGNNSQVHWCHCPITLPDSSE